MIEYRRGDIFKSGADTIVIPVNCVGVAGKGLALAAKKAWPTWHDAYVKWCRAGASPGDVYLFVPGILENPAVVAFASKAHWRAPSRIEWVERGLDSLVRMAHVSWRSVALPALGCGCGELRWADVRPLIHAAAEKMSAAGVDVYVYEPWEAR